MTPCIPSTPGQACSTCRRYAPHLPADPESRPKTVCIDASTLVAERCPMREPTDRIETLMRAEPPASTASENQISGQITHSRKPVPSVYNPDVPRVGGGVYGLDDIRDRCRVDELSGCWVWSMAVSDGGKPCSSLTPRVSLPAGVLSHAPRTVSVARAAWLMSGRSLRTGQVVWRTCCNELCVSPKHLKAGTKREEGAWMAANGHRKGDARRAAINLANVANTQAIPAETVRRIEGLLADGVLQWRIRELTGVHEATISKIANGRHMHQRRVVRGASVFSLAGGVA